MEVDNGVLYTLIYRIDTLFLKTGEKEDDARGERLVIYKKMRTYPMLFV